MYKIELHAPKKMKKQRLLIPCKVLSCGQAFMAKYQNVWCECIG